MSMSLNPLVFLVGCALLGAGCNRAPEGPQVPSAAPSSAPSSAAATPTSGAVPPGTLGRAGPAMLDLAGLQEAVREVQVLGRWRGRPAPVEALDDPLVRRRILTRALENRLIRDEVARRGLTAGPAAIERALVNALAGRGPSHAVDAVPDADTLEAQIAARFEAPVARVRRVAADLLGSEALAQALLDEVPEARIKADWVAAQTARDLEVWQVPRVPTAQEIDEAERTRGAEIEAWYAAHMSRFSTPARVSLHRLFLQGTDAGTRAKLEALRARLAAGEDFEALARSE
ncbi:MAG: peptidyl-prolyl cis-trans isomerase, partial [Myxococcales bacterium]|nr:peptidyl-prolyl cis-trans isomerase [Myxococcales bacterium]